jgi:hypothetical protein
LNTGAGFGAVAGLPIIKELRDYYEGLSFRNNDGSLNLKTCCFHQTQVFNKYGLSSPPDSWQIIQGMRIYPSDVFSPMDNLLNPIAYTKNTLSVHHYDASWFDKEAMDERSIVLRKHWALWNHHEKPLAPRGICSQGNLYKPFPKAPKYAIIGERDKYGKTNNHGRRGRAA